MILHNLAGDEVRVNPMAWGGYVAYLHDNAGVKIYGSIVSLPDGPKAVLETPPVIDVLFEAATATVRVDYVRAEQLAAPEPDL
jgi:hypothetical protein